jgi:hypothetical protein
VITFLLLEAAEKWFLIKNTDADQVRNFYPVGIGFFKLSSFISNKKNRHTRAYSLIDSYLHPYIPHSCSKMSLPLHVEQISCGLSYRSFWQDFKNLWYCERQRW